MPPDPSPPPCYARAKGAPCLALRASLQSQAKKCCAVPVYPELFTNNSRGGGLPYITDRDARRNFKVTILGVALANFIP